MPPGGHLALFAAPALRASGQFQISSLASISWIARSIHMIWIELQDEGIRVMEIRASRWMSKRPVGKHAIVFFNHSGQPEQKLFSALVGGKQLRSIQGVEFEAISKNPRFYLWIGIRRQRRAITITFKSISRPLPRRREVKLVIYRRSFHRYKSLETGMLPKPVYPARRALGRKTQTAELSLERVCDREPAVIGF